jgi:membrane dipeptidase
MLIIDAHLDLAYNSLAGRPVHLPAHDQPSDADGIPTVGLPDLRRGAIGPICATLFCEPSINGRPGYRDSAEAHAQAERQLAWYSQQFESGAMRQIRTRADFSSLENASTQSIPAILLLEGADPIRTADDAQLFYNAGVRIVGLAWKQTRYAGGTGAPGPLTEPGVALVRILSDLGIIHDVSHLAEQSFWQLLDLADEPVIASHSNCRSIVPTDRQLSDEMIHAIIARGGVIGINLFDKFVLPPADYKKRRAHLTDVIAHIRHICDLAQSTGHVGLGTDMDGGFGRDDIPEEIQTSADLHKLADALTDAGFSTQDTQNIMGENWARFFKSRLPLH